MTSTVGWRVIGDVTILIDGEPSGLKGQRTREVLALLLTQAGETVSLDVICNELWGENQPKTAKNSVHRFIADIRRAHKAHAVLLETGPHGYCLAAPLPDVDLSRAKGHVAEAVALCDTEPKPAAVEPLAQALDLLAGTPFAGIRRLPFVVVAEAEVVALRSQAIELLADIQLELGLFDEARGRLSAHVAAYPFQERPAARLMRVLYQMGRQRDALAVYERIRCDLRDELGVLPGPELRELHQQLVGGVLGSEPSARSEPDAPALRVPLPAQLRLPHREVLRQATVSDLTQELRTAVADQEPRVVMIGAEPGAGKSTILAQLGGLLQAEGWCVVHGRAAPSTGSPYTEWASVLEHFEDHCPDESRTSCVTPYERSFGVITGRASVTADGTPTSTVGSKADTFADLVSALTALAESMPMLIVLDDVQWSSSSALDLLEFVATYATGQVVVLAAFRHTEMHEAHPLQRLMGTPAFASKSSVITLPPLTQYDTAVLLRQSAAAPSHPDEARYIEAVHKRSGGNAFFATELARSRGITTTPEEWDIEALPNSVRRVVRARLDLIGGHRVEVLRAAAIVGAEFDLPVLSLTAGLDRTELLEVLEPLLRSDLLVESPHRLGSFRFAHDLVREAVLADLPRALESMLHERAGDAVLAEHSGHGGAARICQHLVAAGNIERTSEVVALARQAGQQAGAQHAYGEARSWFELALNHLDVLEAQEPADPRRRLALTVDLGREMRRMGDSQHRSVLLDAGEVAYEIGADDLLIEVVKSNHAGAHSESFAFDEARIDQIQRAVGSVAKGSADHALLLALLTVETTFIAPLEERVAMSAESVEIARTVADPTLLCRILTLRHTAIQAPQTLSLREAETAEAVEIAASLVDPYPAWWAHDCRVRVLGELGRFAEIDLQLRQMHEVGRTLDQPMLTWMHRWHRAALLLALDCVDEAEAEAQAARSIGASINEPDTEPTYGAIAAGLLLYRGQAQVMADLFEALLDQENDESSAARLRALLAFCRADLGDPEAWRVLELDVANGFVSFHRDMTWSTSMVACAEALAATRSRELCRPMYDMLLPHAGTMAHSGPLFFGPVDRTLGLLAGALDDPRAEDHLAAAAAAMERAGSSYWLARTRLALLDSRHVAEPGASERDRWNQQVIAAGESLGNTWLIEQLGVLS